MEDEFLSDAPAPTNDMQFEIISPTKIKLGPVAKYWAQEHGMSLEQMARWLLTAEAQRQAGLAQRVGES
jgi:hypothetical protein